MEEAQGVDLTGEPDVVIGTISWHEPHPLFVIILVGENEIPFGIQKDLLCAQSPYYREQLLSNNQNNQVECVVKLPDFDVETFGCFQCYLYTGEVYDKRAGMDIPPYTILLSVYRLATKMNMPSLRIQVINAMFQHRVATGAFLPPELIIEAWEQTDEDSALRRLLVNWAAENMRDVPEFRSRLAKSLPQQILAELVIKLSDHADIPPFPNGVPAVPAASAPRTNRVNEVHGINGVIDVTGNPPSKSTKRARKSEPAHNVLNGDDAYEVKPVIKRVRKSEPGTTRKVIRKPSMANGASADSVHLTPEKELDFCKDLIQRMLSGPGFWTRLVGPFKKPVDPSADNVPNYFAVVKKPMDLSTIRNKMNEGGYTSAAQFEADVRQIFQNCYEYWTQDDSIFKLCEQFEKYFNEKWSARHKWHPSVKTEVFE